MSALLAALMVVLPVADQIPNDPLPETLVVTANMNLRSLPAAAAPEPEPIPEPEPEPEPVLAAVDPGAVPEPWLSLAICESGMGGVPRWDIDSGNGFRGGLQFVDSTWVAFGGEEFAPYAHQATPLQQVAVAERVLAEQTWSAWPSCSRKIGVWDGT